MAETVSRGDALRLEAEKALGIKIHDMAPSRSGENSHVYRITTKEGVLALKSYPSRPGDERARAEVEWAALVFLHGRGLRAVPRPVFRDPSGAFLVMEWVDGARVTEPTEVDVRDAARFVREIFALSTGPEATAFPPASEACLSTGEILTQIDTRLRAMAPHDGVDEFLNSEVRPALAVSKEKAERRGDGDRELPPALRRLIPADFGFHNALREADGALRYIDFDYFGWDDPVKLTADFMLHPAMRLSRDAARSFADEVSRGLSVDEDFASRLARHLPLFAMRWGLIVLNPFRADRAGDLPADAAPRQALLETRLATARWVLRQGEMLAGGA